MRDIWKHVTSLSLFLSFCHFYIERLHILFYIKIAMKECETADEM